jgi:dihydrofolate reductase
LVYRFATGCNTQADWKEIRDEVPLPLPRRDSDPADRSARAALSGSNQRRKIMSRLRVQSFSISADGYGAGPDQSLENPLGRGGESLHDWIVPTRTFQQMGGKSGTTGVDDDMAARGFDNIGAWILGRNMFGPIRGAWPDQMWKGWWGDSPPYHVPVFVLTHHERPPLEMDGGTTFHFVTGGIEAALEQAKAAAVHGG